METLKVGQHLPKLQGRSVDGRIMRLPEELHGRYAVILFYRGHW